MFYRVSQSAFAFSILDASFSIFAGSCLKIRSEIARPILAQPAVFHQAAQNTMSRTPGNPINIIHPNI
jgi:hypothetical protein